MITVRLLAAVAAASIVAGRQYQMEGIAAAARNVALSLAGSRLIHGQNRHIYAWRPPRRTGSARS